MTSTAPISPSQSLARKRRKEILASHKTGKKQKVMNSEDVAKTTSKAKVIKSSTKYQNRYEPGVPMTKEEEAEWRREARRQRNRESAAASRNKVRNRIQELESEVEDWKAKYSSLLKRIDILEKAMPSCTFTQGSQKQIQGHCKDVSPITPKTIYVPSFVGTSCGEAQGRVHCKDLSIPFIPDCGSSSASEEAPDSQSLSVSSIPKQRNVTKQEDFHVIEMTSRPA